MRTRGCGPRVGFRGDDDDRIQRKHPDRRVAERLPVVPFSVTPLLEGYSLAREPYREFRKGVKITTYQNDSLTTVDAVLTANYAIYYENRELWEAKGNVVVEKSDGKTLYTQQLFWNARTKKIYSNVDSKIVQNNGRDVFIGEGFESDEEFKDWRFSA